MDRRQNLVPEQLGQAHPAPQRSLAKKAAHLVRDENFFSYSDLVFRKTNLSI
jgi:hypothetical protein